MSNNVISALEEQFNKDCKVINIRYEYEGFSGTERYIIASCLTEKEIWNKYPKQAKLYLEGTSIYLPTYLCTVYGFRRSEVLGLKWHNIDFENETIWIRETLQQSTKEISGDSNYTSSTKTESSNRTLPMIPQVKKILLEQRERQMRNKEFLKDAYISTDYVCTFDNGKEITPNYLTKKFHTLIEKQNNFPQIRFHDLRHSVASNLLNDGFTTVQVAEWLGHSSSTTTLKFYAHIDKTSKLAIAKSLQAD